MARRTVHKKPVARRSARRGKVKQNIVGDIASAAGSAAHAVGGAVSGGAHWVAEQAAPVTAPIGSALGEAAEAAEPYVAPALAIGGIAAYKLAQELGVIPKQGPVAAPQQRRAVQCPPGYMLGPDGRCYPRRSMASYIPTGPARQPMIELTTGGTLTAPSSRAFGASLKSAAPGIVRGKEVPSDFLPRATTENAMAVLSKVSRNMAKTRRNISKKRGRVRF